MRSLSNVTDYACVVAFHHKLKLPDPESVTRPQIVAFIVKESAVNATRFPWIQIQVLEYYCVVVESNLHMRFNHPFSGEEHSPVAFFAAEQKRLIACKRYFSGLPLLKRAFYESENEKPPSLIRATLYDHLALNIFEER